MPIHDWTRVSVGVFHDFHVAWMTHLNEALNNGVLPAEFYSMIGRDQIDIVPDVIVSPNRGNFVPPRTRFTATVDADLYVERQNRLTIFDRDDRAVASVEIVSSGNKSSRYRFRQFLNRSVATLTHGRHLLIVDLHPPTARDPQGIHGAIWAELCNDPYEAPADKPLTLVAYSAAQITRAYIEPIAVGDALSDMPLYLDPQGYVLVPLEATYHAAYKGMPARWKSVLEGD